MTYALDEDGKTILRASFSRNAGQLTAVGTYIGYANPSSAAGWVEYPWIDANGDHLAQTNEVQVNSAAARVGQRLQHREPDRRSRRPTASIRTSRRRPSMGFIVGFDRELMPNLALSGELHLRPASPITRCSRSSA